MPIKIRPITLKDVPSYRQCVDLIAKEGRYFIETEAEPMPVMRAQVRRSLKRKDPFFVAVDGNRIVGYVIVRSFDLRSISHNGDLGIGLLPDYREIGLGTKLMTTALKASRRKFDSLYLYVLSKNRRAKKLYEKVGFELCGKIERAVRLPHGFDDSLVMRKQLKH